MNPKWRNIKTAITAVLVLIIAYQFLAAMWSSLHLSFANDQTQIFCEMTTQAEEALAQEPPNLKSALGLLEYIVNYYPSGTKQTVGSTLDIIVERSRSLAETSIIERLRAETGKDFGPKAEDWLRGLASAPNIDNVVTSNVVTPENPVTEPNDDVLVGTYYRGDGKGTNLTLSLSKDGKFTCQWTGCLGDYGSSAGTWSNEDDQILIETKAEDGMMKGHPLGNLTVIRDKGKKLLVQNNDREFFDMYGVSEYACFLRVTRD